MNLLKILQLPRWVLTDVHPAFHDSESMTALEQTARLYGKMKELIDSYNAWVEETNRLIEEYKNEEDNQDECFENRIIETMNNYIASVDEKMACQEREFDEVRGLIDDLNANIKVEVETATRSIIETMKSSGEFNDLILSTLDEVNDRLSAYEQEITQKFNELQASVQESIDIVANASTDITTLKSDVATLKEDNTKNKNDILTNQTNYYNLDATVDSLVTDNQANKNDIAQNTSDIAKNKTDISQNTSNIAKNTTDISRISTYSTNEVVIGTYNDKTFYRKEYIFLNTKIGAQSIHNIIVSNINIPIEVSGSVNFNGNIYPLGDWTNASMLGYAYSENGTVMVYNPATEERTYNVIKIRLLYTKTTD